MGAAGAQGDAEPAGASAEGDAGANNLSTGTVGAEGTGAVGSGGEGGAGSERREPGVVSGGIEGGGGRGRQQQRVAVGEGNRRVHAGDEPAAKKKSPRGRGGGAGVTTTDQGQRREGRAGRKGRQEEVDVDGHVDAAAGGRHRRCPREWGQGSRRERRSSESRRGMTGGLT